MAAVEKGNKSSYLRVEQTPDEDARLARYAAEDAAAVEEVKRKALVDAAEAKMRKQMSDAYDKASSLGKKKGGKIKAYAKGGYVRAADGCAQRGKTRGRMV